MDSGFSPEEMLEIKEERYKYYCDRVAELRERAAHSIDFIDEQINKISAAAIGLSMTFLGLFRGQTVGHFVVITAWGLFLFAMVLVFVSHHFVIHDIRFLERRWGRWFEKDEQEIPGDGPLLPANDAIMYLANGAFLIGLILIIVFVSMNFIT